MPLEDSPRPPRTPSVAVEREPVVAEADTENVPGLELPDLKWRQERARKGSPYANMKPGQVLPGRRTPGLEGPPKAFRSRAEWKWSFWKKLPTSHARAHLRPWKSLPSRQGKGDG